MIGAIILQAVLIFVNAVFASAEIAVISMNDAKLKNMSQEGNKRAQKLCALTEQPSKFLSTIQVAITLAGMLGGAFAADNFAGPLVDLLVGIGVPIPRGVLNSIAVVLITLILTYFSLVFGELVPKRLAMKKTEEMALGLSGMLYFVSKICAPIVWLLTFSTNRVLRLMGINPDENDEVVTEEEIRMMLAEGSEQGTIRDEETQLIQNIFEFDDTPVEDAGTRRKDVVFLYMEDSQEEWEKTVQEHRFAYFPVCGESEDDIVGILDTKVYFRSKDHSRAYLMKHAMKRPVFVPESMRTNVLFAKMRQTRNYFNIVIDEWGSVVGIVTLHDLVEELVGDLEEEGAPPKPKDIEKVGENTWKILGEAQLDDIAETLGISLEAEDYDTFSGFVWNAIDRVPAEGEHFDVETDGLKIEVKNVKNHMVEYALVQKKEKTKENEVPGE